MTKLLLFIAFFALAGCETLGRKQVIDTQVLNKPVPVACNIDLPKECAGPYALDQVSDADDDVTINRAMRAELEQRQACEIKLKAAVTGCNSVR